MKGGIVLSLMCAVILVSGILAVAPPGTDGPGKQVLSRQPASGAAAVCVDTHLTLTFDQQPALGTAGTIRIYDAMDDKLVDTIDVGAPLNPQGYVFGGTPLQAYPVLVTEKNATIYPHSGKLAYGRKYYVQIDAGVLNVGGMPYAGISGKTEWSFSTKPSAPPADAERITVAADGTGDFATVQGAIDFVPEKNIRPRTILLRKGVYTEIVRFV